MARYRKKPVVIEAVRWEGKYDNWTLWPEWFRQAWDSDRIGLYMGDGDQLAIRTLEGQMLADIGDMVIQGVKGEIYPCKPDIFEATYETIE